jgi:hypothetical protein
MLQKLTKLKASALVVTMMILGIVLVSTLSIALVAVQERKASIGSDSSNQAYYKAEDGVEITMKAITQGELGSVNQIDGYLDNVTCDADGLLVGTGGFKVELKDSNEAKIACNTTTSIASVRSLKSVGTVGGNQRAVQVAVAKVGDAGIGTCYNPEDMLYIQFATTCPSGFTQCSENDIKEAGKKGCLPQLFQYVWPSTDGMQGCLTDGIKRLSTNAYSTAGVQGWYVTGTYSCTGLDKACCHEGS